MLEMKLNVELNVSPVLLNLLEALGLVRMEVVDLRKPAEPRVEDHAEEPRVEDHAEEPAKPTQPTQRRTRKLKEKVEPEPVAETPVPVVEPEPVAETPVPVVEPEPEPEGFASEAQQQQLRLVLKDFVAKHGANGKARAQQLLVRHGAAEPKVALLPAKAVPSVLAALSEAV